MRPPAELQERFDRLSPEQQARALAKREGASTVIEQCGGTPEVERHAWDCIIAEMERPFESLPALSKAKDEARHHAAGTFELVRYSQIERKRVAWLWRGFFPFGKHTMMDGDPDVGKSTLAIDMAARVTMGSSMPDGSPGCEAAGVLILSAEDDPEDTIGPRLDAAGADPDKAFHLKFTERELTICAADIAVIKEMVQANGIKLLVIDPLVSYFDGSVRIYVDHDVRRALLPLKKLAQETGIAIIVIRHWTKQANPNPLHRGGGSIGISAAARAGVAVAFDHEDQNPDHNWRKRVLAQGKMNIGARVKAREFHLDYVPEHDTCRVAWGGESKHTAKTLAMGPDTKFPNKAERAREYLQDVLEDGPVLEQEIMAGLEDLDVSEITLRRAKKKLKVESRKLPDGSAWEWCLPGDQLSVNDHLPMNGSGPDEHLRGDAWEEGDAS